MLLVLLHGSASPWRKSYGMTDRHDVLDVRFISTSAHTSPDRVPRVAAVATSAPPVRRREKSAVVTTIPVDEHAAAVTQPQPPQDTLWNIPATADSHYIAGGNLLHTPSGANQPNVHLPGSGVPIVKGIHMIDPKMQGIGGVARRLQSLFGIPDHHCVGVDEWRRLSTQEILDRHISPDMVEETVAEYHCLPPEHDPWLQ
ncbi:hypothetical protein [Rhodanobacter sp. C05]|uniref:hypothetical protein n=1 Tax=Rhodanobacter sp. C05 TaxID=1945855 RepID=UPI00117A0355|nr:hypothetical protein [Rhodanobacter sp. C05]